MKELLPLGSIVTLKNGTKRVMIVGRLQNKVGEDTLYDYASVLWPEGVLDSSHFYLFNQENIDCLYHIGLQDSEEFAFRSRLEEEYNKRT
ncbi:MAG: DUF4176 domain-containing protein [Bacillota bacterium]|nr:DUF4176 domain-containing protein [Bacillota bacterium]